MAVAIQVAVAVAADTPTPEEQCAKGPVSDIPETVRKSTDEQSGITWYRDQSTTERVNEDAFYLYAGMRGCEVWLRLRIQHVSDKPMNIVRIVINADERTFEFTEPHFKRDSDGKLTWQWFDERVTTDHLVLLFTVAGAKSAVVRFIGANQAEERTMILNSEKAALKTALSLYTALGGKL
jgi:hypothetical protein